MQMEKVQENIEAKKSIGNESHSSEIFFLDSILLFKILTIIEIVIGVIFFLFALITLIIGGNVLDAFIYSIFYLAFAGLIFIALRYDTFTLWCVILGLHIFCTILFFFSMIITFGHWAEDSKRGIKGGGFYLFLSVIAFTLCLIVTIAAFKLSIFRFQRKKKEFSEANEAQDPVAQPSMVQDPGVAV